MDRVLSGKVAIVTGSTKGIGLALATSLARSGADVVVVSRRQSECDKVAISLREYGVKAVGIQTDVTRIDEVKRLVRITTETFGHIDILINNAGSAITKKAELIEEAEWDHVLDVDLKAPFFCSQEVGRQMIEQHSGSIINIASILGLVGEKQVLPYCVAKGGIIQMTRALALEWARHNIRVNAICPGYILTPMNETELKQEKIYNHITAKIPLRRLGTVDDLTEFAILLSSEGSSYMTGQIVTVDGGWTAQ